MAVMALILLAINHIFSGNFDSSESTADRLREDLDESEEVISSECFPRSCQSASASAVRAALVKRHGYISDIFLAMMQT